jgi:hypothetical protein
MVIVVRDAGLAPIGAQATIRFSRFSAMASAVPLVVWGPTVAMEIESGHAQSQAAAPKASMARPTIEISKARTTGDSTGIPQMTSKFAEIVPPFHRRENAILFAAI